ncbi:hypothetical protein ZIOFF_033274 [Zingiber officinale]|uniref:USP domain-containing protein n=1 Tax=Zingiber officinale TaxID=94328 RepID=A0A8J5L713_ZINOF|nr:hypothetical protein ZIOFF_033274 [Zingiber officinale]
MYLSLPLPSTVSRTMTVTVFSGDGSSLPMPFTVTVPKNGCCRDLIQALGTASCLKQSETLLLAEIYGHRIFRYFDKLSEPLSNIKDEDHIVAYTVPIHHGQLQKLEILHTREEGYDIRLCVFLSIEAEFINWLLNKELGYFANVMSKVLGYFLLISVTSLKGKSLRFLADSTCFFVRFLSEPQYNAHVKVFGTPLVTFFSLNSKTGLDIHSAVCSLLAPLLRANMMPSSTGVKTGKENECGPSLDAIVLSDNGIHCSKENLLNSQMELEDTSNCFPALQLALEDGKVIVPTTVDVVQNTCSGSSLKIMMGWSDKLHGIYDFHFLENLPEVFKSGFMLKKTRQEAVTLYSCLEAFLKEEPLGPDDMWYCPKCKEHRQATKKLDLWKLPDILVVHLKRFSYSRFMKNKLDTFVNFPVHNLDLTKYVQQKIGIPQSFIYELYAVSNHYGGLGGGHYSAYAKLIEEDSWYHFDDSHVSSVKEEEIKTSAAYVLFYQRVRCDSSTSGKKIN